MSRLYPIAFALLAIPASPALAETTDSGPADALASTASASAADEIVITGHRERYGVGSTSSGTRTETEIRNIPQALTVISKAQIEDQAMRSIADLLTFVPGATPGTGEGNRDQMTLRGNNSTADFFVDGIRDDVQYFRDLYNVERVEVLRGPNAMIFGRGGGGGVVNRTTKRSSLTAARQFLLGSDSHGGLRLSTDLDQPLGADVGLRVNAVYEDGDSFRRHVGLERFGLNPTVGVALGHDTRLDLAYEYLRDRRTADRGLPSVNGQPLEGFDRSFFGDPDRSFARADVNLASIALEHRLSDGLTLRNRTLYGDYDKFYQNIYPNGPVLAATATQPERLVLGAYSDTTRRRNLFSQTDLVWTGSLGGIHHTMLVGFELGGSKGYNQRRNGVFTATGTGSLMVPLTAATVDAPVTFLATGANNAVKTRVAAAYIQDQIRLSSLVEIVAGLRYDRFSIDVTGRTSGLGFDRTDELWSPRLGLILKPRSNLSLYASYSRSYLPQSGDQFSSLSLTTEALKPERFVNYELGAKWEPIHGLLATAAVYQLDRENSQAPGPVAGTVVLTGAQRSRGLELGLERSITDRWQVSAGYAWQKAEVRERTSACNPATARCEVPLVPRHSFSLWNRYEVSDRLGLGFGAIARSKSYASIGNAVKLPGYARFDAAAYYQLFGPAELQVNVENLFGADYFPTAHNDNNIAPGAPRTIKATVRLGF